MVLDQITQFFDWVKFRALGRQRDNAYVRVKLIERGVGVLVEPSLIPDDDVDCFGITGADLAKKGVAHVQTYSIGEHGFGQTIAGYLELGVKIAPLVTSAVRRSGAVPPQSPYAAQDTDQSVAVFVGYPNPYLRAFW